MGSTTTLQTNWTGWLVAALLGIQISLPFLLRRLPAAKSTPRSDAPSSEERTPTKLLGKSMRWHYTLGFVLPAAALAHGWIPMSSGHMPRTSMTGLWLATYALGLLFLQLLIGLSVERLSGGNTVAKGVLRRVHFAAMLVIAALAISHIWLN